MASDAVARADAAAAWPRVAAAARGPSGPTLLETHKLLN